MHKNSKKFVLFFNYFICVQKIDKTSKIMWDPIVIVLQTISFNISSRFTYWTNNDNIILWFSSADTDMAANAFW